jgi:DNA-binding MarR family transcriptional regulator
MADNKNIPRAEGRDDHANERGRFAYEKLARVLHEKARLSIMTSLAAHPDGLVFNDLKQLCALTDGNLSRQIQQLQEFEFVEVSKGYNKNRPQTLVRLTDEGKKRFLEYIGELENVVADALGTKAAGRLAGAPNGLRAAT